MDNGWSNILLVFNALLWLITFVVYQQRRKYFGVGSAILFFYTSISFLAIHLYNNPYANGLFKALNLFPFLYLYVMIIIASYPILNLKLEKIQYIQSPSNRLLNVVCCSLIFLSLLTLPKTIIQMKDGLVMLLLDSSYGKEAYMERAENYINKSTSNMDIISILSNLSCNISPLFMMYYVTLKNRNRWILYGLVLSSISYPLTGIATGARAALASFMINMSFWFIFIRKYVPEKINRSVKKCIFVGAGLLCIPFILVTFSRNEGDWNNILYSVERYASEGVLRFNNYGLDANGYRYGDYTIVLFKKILGLEPAMYYSSRLLKYNHMFMNESVFYTFVGDFTLDFGPYISFLIFIFTSMSFCLLLKIRNKGLLFYQYILLYLLLVGCLGYFQFPLGRIDGNLLIIALFLLSFIFRYDYYIHKNRK